MIWYLIFCTSVQGGAVCLPPQEFPNAVACVAVGKSLSKRAAEAQTWSEPSFKCLSVKKDKK